MTIELLDVSIIMRIVVVAPYAINSPHYETELEIIQDHLDRGDDVIMLGCSAVLATCDVNPWHEPGICLQCMGRRDTGLGALSRKVIQKSLIQLSEQDRVELNGLRKEFTDLDDLRSYTIENFDIGYGALSSIISILRDPEPDMKSEKVRGLVASNLVASLAVYRSMRNYLREERLDRVYVYNGRYASLRAVLRACQIEGVECVTHETGCDLAHYSLLWNTTIHDVNYGFVEIHKQWDYADPIERVRIGREFYTQSAKGVSTNWFSYTTQQRPGELPADWDATKVNIAIYISSDDEFAAMGDAWRNPIYEDQIDGVERIVAGLQLDKRVHLYLRVHPNLKGIDNAQTRRIAALSAPNLTVIPADSPISTYALMQSASKVISFGSTVGIEAVFWGKPSILAGQCFYRQLGSTYNPVTHEELLTMVVADLPPGDITGALMYGYYIKTYGVPFRLVHRSSVYAATFRSREITVSWLYRLLLQFLSAGGRKSRRIFRILFARQLQRVLGMGM
jgi:hypothetical protein